MRRRGARLGAALRALTDGHKSPQAPGAPGDRDSRAPTGGPVAFPELVPRRGGRRHLGARAPPGPTELREADGPSRRRGPGRPPLRCLPRGGAGPGSASPPSGLPRGGGPRGAASSTGPAAQARQRLRSGAAAARYTCPCDSCLLPAARGAGRAGGCRLIASQSTGGGGGGDYISQNAPPPAGRGIDQSGRCPGVIDVQRGAIRCAGESKHVRPPGGFLIGRPDSQ